MRRGLEIAVLVAVTCVGVSSRDLRAADGMTFSMSLMLDFMYSASVQQPLGHARSYTLQPSRDREIGLMLGYARLDGRSEDVRGRLTLQTGWFPRANYVGEDSEWRNVQEAFLGFRLLDKVWIDVGIMPSHIGYESMIARDNLTLSRSLTADYTPYYETGASVTWTPSDACTVSALILNGWQQIVDVNDELAGGTRLALKPTSDVTVSWSTYLGNDRPRQFDPELRFHNNMWVEWKPDSAWTIVALGDLCLQSSQRDRQWHAAMIAAFAPSPAWNIAARVERYVDADRIFITTPTGAAFRATGMSINVDHRPLDPVLIRLEARRLQADARVFETTQGMKDSDTFFTASVSVDLKRVYE